MPSRCLALLLILGLAPAAVAQQKKELLGTLHALDSERGTLAISQPPKGEQRILGLVSKGLPITDSYGARIRLTDLEKLDRVALTTQGDDDEVIAIRVESNFDWGVVTGVDVARNELIANMSYTPRPLKITPQMRVSLDGKTAAAVDLKQVKPWSHGVKVLLTPDRSRVQEMWIARKYHANPYCRRVMVSGLLVHHDPAKKTLTLITTERYQRLQFNYDPWTHLRLIHAFQLMRHLSIGQLASPGKVTIGYDSDTRRVSLIDQEMPMVLRRRVASIDPAARKIALEASEESPAEEFPIAVDARIVHQGKEARTLADVKAKCVVSLGLALNQKEVVYLSFAEK